MPEFPVPLVELPDCQLNWEFLKKTFPVDATTLPSTPSNGQIVFVVADTANGVTWQLRFSTVDSKWHFVGGPPVVASVGSAVADQSTTSTTYVSLATVGPSIVLPYTGEYYVDIAFSAYHSAANGSCFMSFDIGGSPASDANAAFVYAGVANTDILNGVKRIKIPSTVGGTTLVAKYKVGVGTGNYRGIRTMSILPIRIG